jgi:hypothetical protein
LRPQLLQQRLRFLQIARVETLLEPPVNRSEQFATSELAFLYDQRNSLGVIGTIGRSVLQGKSGPLKGVRRIIRCRRQNRRPQMLAATVHDGKWRLPQSLDHPLICLLALPQVIAIEPIEHTVQTPTRLCSMFAWRVWSRNFTSIATAGEPIGAGGVSGRVSPAELH